MRLNLHAEKLVLSSPSSDRPEESSGQENPSRESPLESIHRDAAPPFPNLNPAGQGGSARWVEPGVVVFLTLLAGLPYLNSLWNGFVYDDPMQVLANPYLKDFRHLHEIFTTWVWSFQGRDIAYYYRPMMELVYLALFQLFGPQAWAFHLMNVLLHIAVVLVLYQVTKKLFRDRYVGALAAALFAIHPIHSEAVTWIAALPDLELTLFFLLAFLLFLNLDSRGCRRVGGWIVGQIAMAGCFALALLSKEPAVTLPVMATVYEHFYRDDRGRTSWLRKFSRYGILWVLCGGYLFFRSHFLGAMFGSHGDSDLKTAEAPLAATALIGQYAWKLVWPVRLSAYYLFSRNLGLLCLWALAGSGVLLASVFFTKFEWKRNRLPTFALLWFFATLAPVLNPRWLAANVFTERYAYLPSVGLCWLAGWGLLSAWKSRALKSPALKGCLAGALGIVAVLAVCRIVSRNRDWHDDQTLYAQTLALEPHAYWIRNNLGKVFWDKGDAAGAEREWRQALEDYQAAATLNRRREAEQKMRNAFLHYRPFPPPPGPPAAPKPVQPEPLQVSRGGELILENMGMVETMLKQYHEAIGHLELAILADPDNAGAHGNLGICYHALGLNAKAEQQLLTAVRLSPRDAKSMENLSEVYFDEGRFQEAGDEAAKSLSAAPTLMGYLDLGLAEWRTAHLPEAETAFQDAAHFDPASGRPHFLLALLYETSGRTAEAETEYRTGLNLDPKNGEAKAAFKASQAQMR